MRPPPRSLPHRPDPPPEPGQALHHLVAGQAPRAPGRHPSDRSRRVHRDGAATAAPPTHQLPPHQDRKESPDPDFDAKKDRILDLYDHPPADGRVICLDEFGPLTLQPRGGMGWYRRRRREAVPEPFAGSAARDLRLGDEKLSLLVQAGDKLVHVYWFDEPPRLVSSLLETRVRPSERARELSSEEP